VVVVVVHEDKEENFVFRSEKQAPQIKTAIEDSIAERLRMEKEAKTQSPQSSTQMKKDSGNNLDSNSQTSTPERVRNKPDQGKSNSQTSFFPETQKNSPRNQTQPMKANDNTQTNSISFPVDWSQVQTNTTSNKQQFQSSQATVNSTSRPKSGSNTVNVPDLIIWD